MPDFDSLMRQIPIDQIARRLGVEHDVAEDAVKQSLPTIVAGLSANAKDSSGAASLEEALTKHKRATPASVDEVDTADGEKIVRNVFGARQGEVVRAVAGQSKADESVIAKILPIVAPIVLSWLASQFFNTKADAAASSPGGIGDILGGLLGGGGGGTAGQGGGALGGLLGGLLGGGKR
jgi:hypothetical protein